MAKKSTNRDSRHNGDTEFAGIDRLAALTAPIAEHLDRGGEVWLKSLCALEEETVRFVSNRLERNTEVVKQCQHARDVSERLAAQQKWLIDLGQDYLQEGLQFGKIMQNIMANSFAELTDTATIAVRKNVADMDAASGE